MIDSIAQYSDAPADRPPTTRDLLLFLWRSRWIALIGSCSLGIAAGAISLIVPNEYNATVTILPLSGRNGSNALDSLTSSMSGLSGLASLAGIHLHGSSGLEAEALGTLQSRILTNQFIQQHHLLPVLFSNEWDPVKHTWKTPDTSKIPTYWDADFLFKHNIRTVTRDPKTGLITLSIRWKNPALAADWANGLVALTNSYLQQRAIAKYNREIAYLDHRISLTNLLPVKNALYLLMEAQIKNEMIAQGRSQFALKVIDPAIAPQKKSSPKRFLWVVGGFLGGLFLSLIGALVRETFLGEERGTRKVSAHQRTEALQPAVE